MKDLIKDILTELLKQLGLEFSNITFGDAGTLSGDETMIRVDIDSPVASRLIGWHGETIDSLQHLLKSMVRAKQNLEKSPFIVLDVDGYRRVQEDKVCHITEQKADFVRRKHTRVALPPMNPYFRRVVHLFVAGNKNLQDITTESIGDGDYRQIVLKLKEGDVSDGGELVPVMSGEEGKKEKGEGEGFENLDV